MNFLDANPVPVKARPYRFSVVKEFLDIPVGALPQDGTGRVYIDHNAKYLNPAIKPDGESPAKKLQELIKKNGGPTRCRLVYITRHGTAMHNVQTGDPDVITAIRSHDPSDIDPKLVGLGAKEAIMAGEMIRTSTLGRLFGMPSEVYTSSLTRTLQTAILAADRYVTKGQPLRIFPTDGLREFMGPGQRHVSDARSPASKLKERIDACAAKLERGVLFSFPNGFPDQDVGFNNGETYVNVDIRFENELVQMLNSGHSHGPVHIVSHNRAIQSFLRVLGYPPRGDDYRVFDFENGATIALLIKMEKRSPKEINSLLMSDVRLQSEELRQIREDYETRVNQGFMAIQKMPVTEKKLFVKDMAYLDGLATEDERLRWRVKALANALAGNFKCLRYFLERR